MKKKFKYTSLVAAGAVTLGLVGGTFAWFTSQDQVANHFSTIGNNSNGSSIKIVEDWVPTAAENITPGKEVNKDVQVKNVDNYDQFIRVKLYASVNESEIVDSEDGTTGALVESKQFNLKSTTDSHVFTVEGYDEIELYFTPHLTNTPSVGEWFYNEEDGYFYYIGKVESGIHTNTLLDAVKLKDTAGNEYKNLDFDIVVVADGIQTTNNAAVSEWNLTDNSVLASLYTEAQDVATPVDPLEGSLEDTNSDHKH